MPYSCPMPGCAKAGNVSALFQHIQAKHPALIHSFDRHEIEAMIMRRDQFTEDAMPVTIVKDLPPRSAAMMGALIVVAFISTLIGFVGGTLATTGYICDWQTNCPILFQSTHGQDR
jgi:hypothetical protein